MTQSTTSATSIERSSLHTYGPDQKTNHSKGDPPPTEKTVAKTDNEIAETDSETKETKTKIAKQEEGLTLKQDEANQTKGSRNQTKPSSQTRSRPRGKCGAGEGAWMPARGDPIARPR